MKIAEKKSRSFSKYTIRLLLCILVIIYILFTMILLGQYYSAARDEDYANNMSILTHQINSSDQSVISFAVLLDALSYNPTYPITPI